MELKELGVKGLTGKNKAELMSMLYNAKNPVPIVLPKKRQKAPAPLPVPVQKRPVMRVSPEPEPKPKPSKVATLAQYLKPYKGEYQDYEDSDGREVMYPTWEIKNLIKMAYEGEAFDDIVRQMGYKPDVVKTMLYDHYENRTDIDNPKPYKSGNQKTLKK